MKRLTKERRDRLILVALGTVVCMFTLWYLVIKTQQNVLINARKQAGEEQSKVANAERLVTTTAEIQKKLAVSTEELKSIESINDVFFKTHLEGARMAPYAIAPVMVIITLLIMCVSQFVSLLLFRTTLGQRLFGFAVVNKCGELAGRGRMLLRWLIIWGPLLVIVSRFATMVATGQPMTAGMTVFTGAKAVLWLACVVVAIVKPEHGVQDDIAGTRIVSR